jgi:hypothetical protein
MASGLRLGWAGGACIFDSAGGWRMRAWQASMSSNSAAPWCQNAVWSLRRLCRLERAEGRTRWRLLLHGSMLVAVLSSMAARAR